MAGRVLSGTARPTAPSDSTVGVAASTAPQSLAVPDNARLPTSPAAGCAAGGAASSNAAHLLLMLPEGGWGRGGGSSVPPAGAVSGTGAKSET